MKLGGIATGIGSLPGTEIVEAVSETFGELPDFPYLPELPARGPGADMIGRTAGLLVDLPVELYAGRWRVAARSGLDMRRTHDFLERDLDTFTERAEGYSGPLKVQAAGPWTLAAGLELALGQAFLQDHGAVRDLAASLTDGLRAHVSQVQARVPGAQVVLQIDEPSLPAVLAGRVPTASGLHTYRSVAAAAARETLASIVDKVGVPVIMHCCAVDAPVPLLRETGAGGLALDVSLFAGAKQLDPIGEAIDAGLTLLAGVVPAGDRRPSTSTVADGVRGFWRDLGFAHELLFQQVVLTPACGLAGASPAQARAALAACREAAQRLAEA